jgi:hypothetical protein
MDIPTPLTLTFSLLRNAEWLAFQTEVRSAIENDPCPGPSSVGINAALWTAFTTEHNNAKKAFDYERANILSKHIAEADHTRDLAYRDLHNAVSAHLHNPAPAKRLAAERIMTFFKNEGDIAQNTFSGESSYIEKIDATFKTTLGGDVAQLQLTPWHNALMDAHHAFLALWRQRTDETALQTSLRMSKERPKLDQLYYHVTGAMQAQAYDTTDGQIAIDTIHRLNVIIIKYKELANRRATKPRPVPDTDTDADTDTGADTKIAPPLMLS